MRIFVKVKTRENKNSVIKIDDNNFKISIKEAPIKGEANRAVVKLLANYFEISQLRLKIVAGLKSKDKTIVIK